MGLLDSLIGAATEAAMGAQRGADAAPAGGAGGLNPQLLITLVSTLLNNAGGLQGLLTKLQSGDKSDETRARFDEVKQDLGYGLLLKRYTNNVTDATDEQIKAAVDDSIPQVLPLWLSFTLYRFESNVRSATVVGIVGAGGIGFELMAALRLIKYDEVSAILLSILICVLVVDGIGSALRKHLK